MKSPVSAPQVVGQETLGGGGYGGGYSGAESFGTSGAEAFGSLGGGGGYHSSGSSYAAPVQVVEAHGSSGSYHGGGGAVETFAPSGPAQSFQPVPSSSYGVPAAPLIGGSAGY